MSAAVAESVETSATTSSIIRRKTSQAVSLLELQAVANRRRRSKQGRVAEVAFSHLAAAAGQEHRVHMELEVQSEGGCGLVLAQGMKATHERLGGGKLHRRPP